MIQKKEVLVKTESQRKGKRCDHAPMLHRYRRESGLSLFDITDLKKTPDPLSLVLPER